MDKAVIQSTLFPPVQQISWIMRFRHILVEQHDTYARQTFRNRLQIAGPNGMQSISVPVKKPDGSKTKMKDIRINYEKNWQDQLIKSIHTAYNKSPFFEFYIDDFLPLINHGYKKLVTLNLAVLTRLLEILEIDTKISLTDSYKTTYSTDLREIVHPKSQYKIRDQGYRNMPYHQLFNKKYGFINNLSIIDLLFNEGPLSYFYLEKTIVNKQ